MNSNPTVVLDVGCENGSWYADGTAPDGSAFLAVADDRAELMDLVREAADIYAWPTWVAVDVWRVR